MPSKDLNFHESPEKAVGEGWLYSEQQQKLCHFKPDTATVHAQWIAIRTYSYVPPRPPEPMTRRRMLRHNAIEAWQTMEKTGWRRCPNPVHTCLLSAHEGGRTTSAEACAQKNSYAQNHAQKWADMGLPR